jgi:cobalt-zinc-cadmium efflux system membrane fusion protein
VRSILDNEGRLLAPEMYATVRVSVDPKRTLAIPAAAALRLGDQTVVFVARGEAPEGRLRFERVPVELEDPDAHDLRPVSRGLRAGETIVASGATLLSGML